MCSRTKGANLCEGLEVKIWVVEETERKVAVGG